MRRKRLLFFITVIFLLVGISSSCGVNSQPITFRQAELEPYSQFENGCIWFGEGFTDVLVTDTKSALDVIRAAAGAIDITDADAELNSGVPVMVGGVTYYRFDQQYKGIPVTGRSVILAADESGHALLLSSNYMSIDALSTEPEIGAAEANDCIVAYLNYTYPDTSVCEASVGELVITCAGANAELCYTARGYVEEADKNASIRDLFVSAENGDILSDNNAVKYVSTQKNFEGQSGWHTITVDYEKPTYTMLDEERGINGMKLSGYYIWDELKTYEDLNQFVNRLTWDESEAPDKSAVDAMAYLEYSYDYFNDMFGYTPGGMYERRPILFFTHVLSNPFDNSAIPKWRSASYIPYDLYDMFVFGENFPYESYVKYIDAVAHEYTHGVINSTAGLNGELQPSAINEAYADIFGILIEASFNGSEADWIVDCADRDIASPQKPYIKTYDQYTEELDEHYAGTLISHTASLINRGLDAPDGSYNAGESAIGDPTVLANLWYRSLLMLQSNAGFTECRSAVEEAARQMYGEGRISENQLKGVSQAFDETGIPKGGSLSGGTSPSPSQNPSSSPEPAAADVYGNTAGNLILDGMLCRQGDWIYYPNASDGFKLYKMRLDGTEKQKITDETASCINVIGDWIYYMNGFSSDPTNNSLCKIRTDGTGRSELCDHVYNDIIVVNEWIYYTSFVDMCIYKIKTDGTDKTKLSDDADFPTCVNVKDGWVYYSNFSDNRCIYKMRTDGSERTKINNEQSTYLIVDGDWIYYLSYSDFSLHRIKTDGSEETALCGDYFNGFNLDGDWIYFCNYSDNNSMYKIKVDGTEKTRLGDGNGMIYPYVAGEWLYFSSNNDKGALYRIGKDGSGLQLVSPGYSGSSTLDWT